MKRMKRFLSLALCLSMVLPMLLTTGAAAEAQTVIATQDFQAAAVDTAPEGWNVVTTDGGDPAQNWVKVIQDPEDPDNQILAVSATQSKYETHATYTLPETITGEGLVSLRIYFPEDAALNPEGLPDSAGVHLFSPESTQAVSLMNKGSAGALGHRPSTSQTSTLPLQAIELGTWYDLDIRVNVEDNTYTVWLDGVQLPADAAEIFTFRYAQTGINAVRVAAPKNINGTIYADDVVVRTGAAEEIASVVNPDELQVAYGTPAGDLGLPETVKLALSNGASGEVAVEWDFSAYQPEQSGKQTITGTLKTGALYINALDLKAEASVVVGEDTVDRNVTAVSPIAAITVLPGTAQQDIPFPETVEVTLEPGGSAQLPVSGWTAKAGYEPATEGDYVFEGELTLSGTIKNPDGLKAEVTVQVRRDVEAEAFQTIQARWREYLIGGALDESDPQVAAYITSVNEAANEAWSTLIKASENPDRILLWPDLDMNTGTPHYEYGDTSVPAREEFNEVGTSFSRLLSLVKAYSTQGCDLYQNAQVLSEIIAGYDLLTKSYYNAEAMLYGNWYTWEIGITQSFLQGLMILGDLVPQEKMDGYLAILNHFAPDGTTGTTRPPLTSPGVMTGANLLDKASSAAMIAVLSRNTQQLEQVRGEVKTVFKYSNNTNDAINSSDDGFWMDGSYIQHEGIAYNGGYGSTLYRQIGIFFAMFHDTPWEFSYEDNAQDIVYGSIFDGLEPLIYEGHFMDMTAGRGVSRVGENDRNRAVGILAALLPYLGSMPTEEMESRFESMLKYFIGVDEEYFYSHTSNIYAILLAKELMADETVEPRSEYVLHKVYPSMDKTVHTMSDYSFGVSMHSNRTYNHEFINDDGKRTWNISDGMTYLYLEDDQYGEGYWATVDPRRLPGTTTEFVMRGNGVGQDKKNPFPFVGMAVLDDLYGVTGMHLKTLGSGGSKDGTEAKKSWFMFDDEIVALGSGITSETGNFVETVIDNRRIADDASNEVQVNGQVRDDILDNGEEGAGVASRFLRISDASDSSGSLTIDFSSFLTEAGVKEGDSITVETQIRFPVAVNFFQTNLLDAAGNQVVYTFSRNDGSKSYQSRNTDSGNQDTKIGNYKTNSWFDLKFVTDPKNKQFTVTMSVSGSDPVTQTLPYANAAAGDAVKIRFGTQSKNSVDGSLDVNYVKVSTSAGEQVFYEDFFNFNTASAPSWAVIGQDPAQNIEVTVEDVSAPAAPKGTNIENVTTIHLDGEAGSQIGYYFPQPSTVKVLKEVRTCDWSEVGAGSGEVTNGFATFTFDHGTKPVDASYAYVVLPNMTAEETQAYAQQAQPDISILAQTNDAHVVRENTLKITAGNLWNATEEFQGGFKVSAPASVMLKEEGESLVFSVSDPTQRAASVTVTYNGAATGFVSGEGVEVVSLNPITFTVNTAASYGQSFTATFTKDASVKPNVTAVAELESLIVKSGTSFDALPLPETVEVSLTDASKIYPQVAWSSEGYNGTQDGVYTLTGTLQLPADVTNTKGLTASITVVVGDSWTIDFEDETLNESPEGWMVVTTSGGDAAQNWVKVIADPDNQDNQIMAVSATQSGFETHATFPLPTAITGEAGISLRICFPEDAALNPAGLPNSAGVHLFDAANTNQAVSLMNTSSALGHRPGTSASTTRALKGIETGVWYDLDIRVDAESQTYSVWLNGERLTDGGENTFTFRKSVDEVGCLRIAAPKSYNGTVYADDIQITLGAAKEITSVAQPEGIKAPFGTAFDQLALPETVSATLEGGEQVQLPVQWNSADYMAGQPGAQIISGLLQTGAAYSNSQNLVPTITVTVGEDTTAREIESVDELSSIHVEVGTAQDQLPLPSSVTATLTGGVERSIPVSGWTAVDGYDGSAKGSYLFEGTLTVGGLLTNPKGLKAQVTVYVGQDEFDVLREKWYYQIAGSNDFDAADPDVASYLEVLNTNAADILTKFVAPEGGDQYAGFVRDMRVFTDYPMLKAESRTGSSQITLTYDRLKSLALAYKTKGTDYYNDQELKTLILTAMDFMYEEDRYSEQSYGSTGKTPFGNWYDWEIGTPLRYLDLLVLMYDDLSQQQIDNFTGSVHHYSPSPSMTGANKIWKCSVVAENAILMKSAEQLKLVAPGVKSELKYVTSSDGFYADGSYVQHTYYPYTGGYGKAFIVVMAPMMSVLAGTEYAIKYDDGAEQVFLDAVFKSYEPFLINGGIMDMVRNREISRAGGQDHIAGRQVIRAIMMLTDAMEGEQQERALSMVKYFLEDEDIRKQIFQDDTGFFLEYYVALPHILKGKEILADESIESRGPLSGYFKFPSMARVSSFAEAGWAIGISMSGWNVKTYEVVNNEGLRMWHTADGMFYLYNTDKGKYAENFWGTVDLERLPGTTVEHWGKDKGTSYRSGASNGSAIVGGTDFLGQYGATAFEINNGAHAKKSYFVFDDEVVFLGSDITSEGTYPIETIVENYKAQLDLSNRVVVDGVEQTRTADADDFNGKHEDVNYIYMEGNVEGSDVGYYFPGGADVTGLRETRTDKWTRMNTYEKFYYDEDVTNSFITMYLEHGANPAQVGYQYVILPGMSEAETASYSANADVEVLENSTNIHAVRENDLGITAVNFYAAGESAAAGVKASAPASVMYGTDDQGNLTVTVADVTNKLSGTITVELSFPVEAQLSGSDYITMATDGQTTTLTVDVTGSRGQTRTAAFSVKPAEIPVTGVELDKSELTLVEGGSGTLTATVAPENATNKAVTWTSSNDSVATVADGVVTAVAPGTATITVTTDDGGFKAECAVTVAADTWTVTFHNREETTTAAVEKGEPVAQPADPTLEGYYFDGWYTEPECLNAYDFSQAVTEDLDLYAKWLLITPSRDRYTITLEGSENGSLLSSARYAREGSIITITAKADEGYELDSLTVTTKGGDEVEITRQSESKYTFTMPDDQVTVKAAFAEAGSTEEGLFEDVAEDAWYYDAVAYAVEQGIMAGVGNGRFDPDATLTRAQLAQMLYALEGTPKVTESAGFLDVAENAWYTDAVNWAAGEKLVTGYGDGRFGPDDALTREQLTAILCAYAKAEGKEVDGRADLSKFSDIDTLSPWAEASMSWAVSAGLVGGMEDGTLAPAGTATRAQMAQIMMNFCQKVL